MYLRERFPILESKTYLNSGSYAALSTDVRAAYEQYLRDRDEFGAHWEHWVAMLEDMRARIAGLLNAGIDEMAITSSLSEGVNALFLGFVQRHLGVVDGVLLLDTLTAVASILRTPVADEEH